MKKTLMASVLLASVVFAMPVYADNDRTPDEYNSYDKYASPADQSYGPVVNDYPKAETDDDSERFARAAGQLIQRAATGKEVSGRQKDSNEPGVVSEQNSLAENEIHNKKEAKKDEAAIARQNALGKRKNRLKRYCRKPMVISSLNRIKSIPDVSTRRAGRFLLCQKLRSRGGNCNRRKTMRIKYR